MTASTNAETVPVAAEPTRTRTWREWLGGPWTGPIVTLIGSALIAIAGFLPVWGTRLVAPQYPKGLALWFYGDRVEGPVREVNGLNHYIGMQTIELSRVPEMALWPLAIIGAALLLVVAVLWRGWLSLLALVGLWLIPVVILLDIQRWLITFGTELDPTAALRMDSFVPLAVGPIQVWNFSITSYPGPALLLIWFVALLATLGRLARQPERRVRWVTGAAAMIIAMVGTMVLLVPATAEAAEPVAGPSEAIGPPAASIDLQVLVDEAPPGSTLVVPAGSYRTHLVIDRPMELVAEGRVVLDGGGIGSVVTITADDVSFRGFEVANTGGQVEMAAAIKIVEADNVHIEGNTVRDFFHGIAGLGATNIRLVGNSLTGTGVGKGGEGSTGGSDHLNTGRDEEHSAVVVDSDPRSIPAGASGSGPQGQGHGIYLWNTRAVTVADNTVKNVRDGVYMSFVEDGLVDGNDVQGSRYAVHSMFGGPVTVFGNSAHENLAGLVFMYTEGVLAGRNIIEDQRSAATGVGVMLKDAEDVRIAENVIARNRIGLKAEGTRRAGEKEASILRNRFDSNTTAVSLFPSADLGFGANTFEGNLTDVHADDRGVARRNDWTFQGTGNHWSGYAGYDLDGDGVGDIPHTASGALQLILSDVPALRLYHGSPALTALDSAQELWEADRAQVMADTAPRLGDYAPTVAQLDPVAAALTAEDESVAWYALGGTFALVAIAVAGLGRARWQGRDA